jgi:hypothetical protein
VDCDGERRERLRSVHEAFRVRSNGAVAYDTDDVGAIPLQLGGRGFQLGCVATRNNCGKARICKTTCDGGAQSVRRADTDDKQAAHWGFGVKDWIWH